MEREPISQRSMYAELPSPLSTSKCLSGECKPCPYTHSGPSEHLRKDYHQCRSYPLEIQQGPFDRTPNFRVARDLAAGHYYHPGTSICMCNDPSSRLNAWARDQPYGDYTRGLPSLPGRPWPQWDAWISPYRRGRGKYYGWYHNDPQPKQFSAETHESAGPCPGLGACESGRARSAGCKMAGGKEGAPLHCELLKAQRLEPGAKVDPGYLSRWSFHQP